MAATICGRIVAIDFDPVLGFGVGGCGGLDRAARIFPDRGPAGGAMIPPGGRTRAGKEQSSQIVTPFSLSKVLVGRSAERRRRRGQAPWVLPRSISPTRRRDASCLDLSELRFAARVEDLGDGNALLAFDILVQIGERPAQFIGQQPADRWFCPEAMNPTR